MYDTRSKVQHGHLTSDVGKRVLQYRPMNLHLMSGDRDEGFGSANLVRLLRDAENGNGLEADYSKALEAALGRSIDEGKTTRSANTSLVRGLARLTRSVSVSRSRCQGEIDGRILPTRCHHDRTCSSRTRHFFLRVSIRCAFRCATCGTLLKNSLPLIIESSP